MAEPGTIHNGAVYALVHEAFATFDSFLAIVLNNAAYA